MSLVLPSAILFGWLFLSAWTVARLTWWVDPDAAVTAELAAAHHITQGLALHQAYRAVVLRERLPQVGALFLAGLISDLLVRAIVNRTAFLLDTDLIAAVDADLAAEILGWGPLSVKKTDAAIEHRRAPRPRRRAPIPT